MTTNLPGQGQEAFVTPIISTGGKVSMKGLGKVDFVRFEDPERLNPDG